MAAPEYLLIQPSYGNLSPTVYTIWPISTLRSLRFRYWICSDVFACQPGFPLLYCKLNNCSVLLLLGDGNLLFPPSETACQQCVRLISATLLSLSSYHFGLKFLSFSTLIDWRQKCENCSEFDSIEHSNANNNMERCNSVKAVNLVWNLYEIAFSCFNQYIHLCVLNMHTVDCVLVQCYWILTEHYQDIDTNREQFGICKLFFIRRFSDDILWLSWKCHFLSPIKFGLKTSVRIKFI